MHTFKVQTIALAQIVDPDGYQRDIDDPTVLKIVTGFDPAQWDLPKVAEVGERQYRVIAGQHRVEAARDFMEAVRTGGDWPFSTPAGYLEVQVILGMSSVEEEADLFLKDASNKKPIAPYYKHRAALVAGYPMAVDVQAALDRYGVRLVRRQKTLNGETFVAISALNMIWRRAGSGNGGLAVAETLRLRSTWKKDDSYRSEGSLIGGLGIVVIELLKTDGHVRRLEKVVQRKTALSIASAAVKLRESQGMSLSQPLTYAVALRELLPPAGTRAPAGRTLAADAEVVRETVLKAGSVLSTGAHGDR